MPNLVSEMRLPSDKSNPELSLLCGEAIRQWGPAEHVTAVLIKGSAGVAGSVPVGGDLDLLVVVGDRAVSERFAELRIEGVPVEIFPLEERSLNDVEDILRHQSLPLELVQNIHLLDSHGVLARVRQKIEPRLFEPQFVTARRTADTEAASKSLHRADTLLQSGDAEGAARDLTVALWHGAAAAATAAHLRPTTRRCLALWAKVLRVQGRLETLSQLEAAAGPEVPAGGRAALVNRLAATDDRVGDAVRGMVLSGEARWIVFPFLRSTLWAPTARRHTDDSRAEVLDAVGWGPGSLQRRMDPATLLVQGLADLGQPQ